MSNTNTATNPLTKSLLRAKHGEDSNPCYRVEGLRFTLAPKDSANPGYVYVKDDNYKYLGKIDRVGKFSSYNAIEPDTRALIAAVTNAPEATAMTYGKQTGTCCCCGRTLTNKLSVELGIGPVCRGGWFPAPEEVAPPDILDLGLDTMEETAQHTLPISTAQQEAAKEAKLEVQDLVDAYLQLELSGKIEFHTKIIIAKEMMQ